MGLNPTIVLALGLWTSFFAVVLAGLHLPTSGHPTIWIGLGAVQLIVIIATFTVAHDAVHRVASRNRFLNAAMLWGCGLVFLFDPILFRRIHLLHHAHTHRPIDPDRFTAARHLPKRIVRSSLLFAGYYLWALRNLRRDSRWRLHLVAVPLIPICVAGTFVAIGRIDLFLLAWLIPLLLADAVLALFISSLPHDHDQGVTTDLKLPKVVCWLLGNNHLHGTHHAHPRVPWYQLSRVASQPCPSVRQRHR